MRRLLALALLLPSFAFAATDYGSATVAQVTSIYDGDTFRADIDGWPDVVGHRVPIRVAGVDTPEMRGSCPAEKTAARLAKQFTVAHLRNAETIRLDHIERGKYFRLVANVMVDGEDLGQMLIDNGHGVPYGGGTKTAYCD